MLYQRLPYSVLLCVTIFLLILLGPFLFIGLSVFEPDKGTIVHLVDTVLFDATVNTIGLLLGVALFATSIGVTCAWCVVRYSFFGKRFLEWALIMPLAMPAYVLALVYGYVLDSAGPIQFFIRDFLSVEVGDYWFPSVRSLLGAMFILSLALYPYIYITARNAFLFQSSRLSDVGRVFGVNRIRFFWTVTMPIARPAIVAGLSLVLMEVIADIGVVYLFGVDTFTTLIYRTWYNLFDIIAAAKLAAFLMIFVVILMAMERFSRRKNSRLSDFSDDAPYVPRNVSRIKGILLFLGCSFPVLLGVIFPVWMLFYWVAVGGMGDNIYKLLDAAFNSLLLAFIGMVVILIVAFIFVYIGRYYRFSILSRLIRLATIGYAVPGSVIAVGVFMMLNGTDRFLHMLIPGWGLWLSGTLVVLVVAYMIRFLALAFYNFESALSRVPDEMDNVARSLGGRFCDIVKTIHFPFIKGGIVASMLIVMVDIIKELPATLILRPFNFDTLAIRVFELAGDERILAAAPSALLLFILGSIPTLFLVGNMLLDHRQKK